VSDCNSYRDVYVAIQIGPVCAVCLADACEGLQASCRRTPRDFSRTARGFVRVKIVDRRMLESLVGTSSGILIPWRVSYFSSGVCCLNDPIICSSSMFVSFLLFM